MPPVAMQTTIGRPSPVQAAAPRQVKSGMSMDVGGRLGLALRTTVLCVALVFGHYAFAEGVGVWRSRWLVVIGLLSGFVLIWGNVRSARNIWLIGAVALGGIGINTALYGAERAFEAPYLISNLIIATVALSGPLNLGVLQLMVYCAGAELVFRNMTGMDTPDGIQFFNYGSRNMASWLILAPASLYYAECSRQGRDHSLWPALTCLVVSVLYEGRGGIISAALLGGGLLVTKVNSRRSGYALASFGLTVIALGLLLSRFEDIALERLAHLDEHRFDSVERWQMWVNYFDGLKGVEWLTGGDLDADAYWRFYEHTHNSWLQAHTRYGPGGIVLVCSCIVAVVLALRHQRVLAVVLLVLIGRVATDSLAFTRPFDFVLWIPLSMALALPGRVRPSTPGRERQALVKPVAAA